MIQVERCAKCGAVLERGCGRPSRFCAAACKASAEAEQRRLNANLRKLEARRANEIYGPPEHRQRLDASIAELQQRYDHLAGVPKLQTGQTQP